MASARWESIGSTSDLDLVKLDEETLREDLLLMDMKRKALTTLSPSRLRNLAGEKLELLGSLKLQITATLLLCPEALLQPPCFRSIVGLSLTSGLKLTRLLALFDIADLQFKRGPMRRKRERKRGCEGWKKGGVCLVNVEEGAVDEAGSICWGVPWWWWVKEKKGKENHTVTVTVRKIKMGLCYFFPWLLMHATIIHIRVWAMLMPYVHVCYLSWSPYVLPF